MNSVRAILSFSLPTDSLASLPTSSSQTCRPNSSDGGEGMDHDQPGRFHGVSRELVDEWREIEPIRSSFPFRPLCPALDLRK